MPSAEPFTDVVRTARSFDCGRERGERARHPASGGGGQAAGRGAGVAAGVRERAARDGSGAVEDDRAGHPRRGRARERRGPELVIGPRSGKVGGRGAGDRPDEDEQPQIGAGRLVEVGAGDHAHDDLAVSQDAGFDDGRRGFARHERAGDDTFRGHAERAASQEEGSAGAVVHGAADDPAVVVDLDCAVNRHAL
jgi:hypothetical protein